MEAPTSQTIATANTPEPRSPTRPSTIWRWWLPRAAGNERVHLLAMVATKSGRQRESPPSGDGGYQERPERDSPPSGDGGYQTNPGNETIHLLAMVAKKKWPSGQNNRGDWIRTSDLYVPNVALYQAEPRPDRMGKAAKDAPPEARSTTPPIRRDRSPCSVCGSSDGTLNQRCVIPNLLHYLASFAFATQYPTRLPQIHLPGVQSMKLSASKRSAPVGDFESRI
jgi:hypothetical protein